MKAKEDKFKFFCDIQSLRIQHSMTLEELAERSGVPLWMLEQLERQNLPEEMTVDDAIALARALRCKLCELFR